MRIVIFAADVVAIVGSDQRNAKVPLKPQQIRTNLLFQREPLVLNLEEEVPFPEDVAERTCGIPGGIVLACHEVLTQLTGQASRKSNQSFRMLRKKCFAHPRLVIHAVQRRFGGDLHQVAITLVAFGEY